VSLQNGPRTEARSVGKLEAYTSRANACRSDRSPNSVTTDITHSFPSLCFFQHEPLAYAMMESRMDVEAKHQPEGETGWTLSRSWIR
jgi:hypothetical protein